MFNNKKKIKELERYNENLNSHLKGSQTVVREKCEEIEKLNTEINSLKLFIADNFLEKISVKMNTGLQLSISWSEHNLSLEEVYQKSEELNKQGWYTVIENETEDEELFIIKIYSKA
jgi:phage shock protein A